NSTVDLLGEVSGTLNHLNVSNLQLVSDGVFVAATEFRLNDMTNGEKLSIFAENIKLKTSYINLKEILPTFVASRLPDFIDRFGTMDFAGSFDLNPEQITIDGNAITALGDADLNVLLQNYRNHLRYSGTVVADDINLRQITEVKELGFVKGKMQFDGVGTDVKTLRLTAKGNLDYLDLLDKRYQNVSVDGKLERSVFDGVL